LKGKRRKRKDKRKTEDRRVKKHSKGVKILGKRVQE
jgi:hypothetical protein